MTKHLRMEESRCEFDHRYNYRVTLGYNDIDRMLAAIRGVAGKRLTYHQSRKINFSLYR
ncbi:MAG: hypothetical protein ACLQJ7_02095 [Syntrophobacteraceae bacterium]